MKTYADGGSSDADEVSEWSSLCRGETTGGGSSRDGNSSKGRRPRMLRPRDLM